MNDKYYIEFGGKGARCRIEFDGEAPDMMDWEIAVRTLMTFSEFGLETIDKLFGIETEKEPCDNVVNPYGYQA
jgi:hypothetical protein